LSNVCNCDWKLDFIVVRIALLTPIPTAANTTTAMIGQSHACSFKMVPVRMIVRAAEVRANVMCACGTAVAPRDFRNKFSGFMARLTLRRRVLIAVNKCGSVAGDSTRQTVSLFSDPRESSNLAEFLENITARLRSNPHNPPAEEITRSWSWPPSVQTVICLA
jgi:hypothetical protein